MATAEFLLDQITRNVSPGAFFEDGVEPIRLPATLPVRLIAYYLPQFHPIAENDAWWSPGFTEWSNVTRALPRFAGHYQPRLPRDLGFYDLRNADVLRRQAELARSHGVEGFCFHHYWFGGRRLLEKPLSLLLANPDIDLPFCVNWANENWTRAWDGQDREVLLAQQHSPDDDVAFARSLIPLFRDQRYIRVGGRPLLMLYRPALLPDMNATCSRWREVITNSGVEDPFIVMAQTFGDRDPRRYGMDAAAGFPPHIADESAPVVTPMKYLDHAFRGTLKSYIDLMEQALALQPEEYPYFPGVCPQWDNEARRPGRGMAYVGSTPAAYGAWLEGASRWVMRASQPDQRIVFINAWNEWAEGAYLEPDRHFGYAYLRETARVLARLETGGAHSSAVVEHPETAFVRMQESRSRRVIRRGSNILAAAAEGVAGLLRSV